MNEFSEKVKKGFLEAGWHIVEVELRRQDKTLTFFAKGAFPNAEDAEKFAELWDCIGNTRILKPLA